MGSTLLTNGPQNLGGMAVFENEWPIDPDPWVFAVMAILGMAIVWLITK